MKKRKASKPLVTSIKTLGDWIRVKRKAKNLSPHQLAAKMGIATALIHAWEDGICEPDECQREILIILLASDPGVDLRKPNG